ncbi:MAG: Endonuclease/Exonuclease/phosphatase family protein [Methanomassiliicoccales archaeon PtaU1.Bin124]|nr:MAG: Endonuclease/Exonuclease/phosphatase family protein [Methanomassiliicoccales archaeon PtaU1.Bin124]
MRIMEWNIRHGGSRDSLPGIMASLKHHDPDLVCLIEFRQERIIELSLSLAKNGWPYVLSSMPPQNTNGILVAAKRSIESVPGEPGLVQPHRWLEIRPARSDLTILAVQVPSVQDLSARREFWRSIKEFAHRSVREGRRSVIVGDLNTGLEEDSEGTSYLGDDDLKEVLSMGWRDVWREYHQKAREYSWYSSQGKGYRLDHVLVSPDIDRPVWAKYSHEERLEGISDHSPLIFDIGDRLTEEGSVQSALR